MTEINIIGAGLAGCEAALRLSDYGYKINLFDSKPDKMTAAHCDANFAELVCSNSLKSVDCQTASGMLKKELHLLDCKLMDIAESCKVPAGNALAVDRKKFAETVTDRIMSKSNIRPISELVTDWDIEKYTIIATGPLTLDPLADSLQNRVGKPLAFYDAIAPIVAADTLDYEHCFFGARYGKGEKDYLNCPLDKETYSRFYDALINAERLLPKDFEVNVFESCMPVEIMAMRGFDTLRFGPLRPVGLSDRGEKNYAVLQLRKEDKDGQSYNLVGFQTNLKFPEQKRVFGIIPALKNAEFLRYGQMHRNTFVNAPEVINSDFSLKKYPKTFIAGQLSGVEGYVESIASGLLAAENVHRKITGEDPIALPVTTILGAITSKLTTSCENFQPINANFGILPSINTKTKDRAQKKQAYFERGINDLKQYLSI